MAKNKKWIQAASASIKKRGTEGVCTGDKFGGPTCPRGSKRYNLAKVFKGMASKKKKAAWGSMIHARSGEYANAYDLAKHNKGKDRITTRDVKNAEKIITRAKAYDLAKSNKKSDRVTTRDVEHAEKIITARKHATGAMIHAKHSKYVKGNVSKTAAMEDAYTKSKKKLTRKEKINIATDIRTGPLPRKFFHNKRILHSDPRMLQQGGILKAQHGVHAQVRSSLAAKGMKAATAGTAYKSTGWINKNLNKLKDFMKAGIKTTSMKGSITPSKWLSKIPKGSQLKTLAKAGGRRSLALAGGPIGLGMYAGTSLAKAAVTSAFKGYKKEGKWTKEGTKRLESQARAREALMAKRNKARNAQTGAMIRATHGVEVLGKQSVPFESQGATANLAAERQGRKGAAVRGFNFKGVF